MTTDALGTAGGVVSAQDHRLANASLITGLSTGILDVRTGVFPGPNSLTLVTGTSATAPMTVSVAAFQSVTKRTSASGAYLGPTLEAATTVTITAAPASNSRIDVVYVKQSDADATVPTPDGSTTPTVAVVTGTAAASPTKPAIPVGAEELGTVTVAAGATSTNGAGVTIANTARQTVAAGGIVPVRSGDSAAGPYSGAYRDLPGTGLQRYDSGFGVWGYPLDDTGWLDLSLSAPFTAGTNGAKYRVRGGICYFSVDLTRTTAWTAGTIAFTFPAGAAPTRPYYAHTVGTSGIFNSTVATTGALTLGPAGSANDHAYVAGTFPVT